MPGKLRITLARSPISCRQRHRRTLKALGLNKIGQQVEHIDSPEILGMIAKVGYLLKVERPQK